jgi:hypothetical protein
MGEVVERERMIFCDILEAPAPAAIAWVKAEQSAPNGTAAYEYGLEPTTTIGISIRLRE